LRSKLGLDATKYSPEVSEKNKLKILIRNVWAQIPAGLKKKFDSIAKTHKNIHFWMEIFYYAHNSIKETCYEHLFKI